MGIVAAGRKSGQNEVGIPDSASAVRIAAVPAAAARAIYIRRSVIQGVHAEIRRSVAHSRAEISVSVARLRHVMPVAINGDCENEKAAHDAAGDGADGRRADSVLGIRPV